MKKTVWIAMLLVITMLFAACGKEEKAAKPDWNTVQKPTEPTIQTTTPTVELNAEQMVQECLMGVFCAQSAETAQQYMTEDCWESAQDLVDYYPDEAITLKTQKKGDNGQYDIWYYEVQLAEKNELFESGYVVLQRGEGSFLLCVNRQVQNDVIAPFLCGVCGGNGTVTSGTPSACGICGGTGMQYNAAAYFDAATNMWMGQYVACGGCGGSGQLGGTTTATCSHCNGIGIKF